MLMGEVQRLGSAFDRTRRAVEEGWRSFNQLVTEERDGAEAWKSAARRLTRLAGGEADRDRSDHDQRAARHSRRRRRAADDRADRRSPSWCRAPSGAASSGSSEIERGLEEKLAPVGGAGPGDVRSPRSRVRARRRRRREARSRARGHGARRRARAGRGERQRASHRDARRRRWPAAVARRCARGARARPQPRREPVVLPSSVTAARVPSGPVNRNLASNGGAPCIDMRMKLPVDRFCSACSRASSLARASACCSHRAPARRRGSAMSESATGCACVKQATEGYTKASEKVSDLVERGRDSYERARQSVSRGVDEVRRHAQDAADRASRVRVAAPPMRSTTSPAAARRGRPDRGGRSTRAVAGTPWDDRGDALAGRGGVEYPTRCCRPRRGAASLVLRAGRRLGRRLPARAPIDGPCRLAGLRRLLQQQRSHLRLVDRVLRAAVAVSLSSAEPVGARHVHGQRARSRRRARFRPALLPAAVRLRHHPDRCVPPAHHRARHRRQRR